jgi:uncharacterized protein (TIGR04255 family)
MRVFDNSPVSQVWLSVDFRASGFTTVLVGLYWQKIKDRFPVSDRELNPLLTAADEMPGSQDSNSPSDLPPIRRVLFESTERSRVIHLQEDQFNYGWRKRPTEIIYPRYGTIRKHFDNEWTEFCNWYLEESGQPVTPLRYGLTYVNRLDSTNGWSSAADSEKLFEFYRLPESWKNLRGLLTTTYFTYEVASIGKNEVAMRPFSEKDSAVSLELRASSHEVQKDLKTWFDDAHKELFNRFVSATTAHAHSLWGEIHR